MSSNTAQLQMPCIPAADTLMQTVSDIAFDEGFGPTDIKQLFHNLSSHDFVCGEPTLKNKEQIPVRVWQRVCRFYHAQSWCPYVPREYKVSPTVFKESSMVFVSNKLTKALIQKRVILEAIPTTRRLYQYINWTMRINKVAQTMAVFQGRSGRMVCCCVVS